MKFNEEFYEKLATPVSQSEDEKCRKAIDDVVDALKRGGWSRINKKDKYDFIGESNTAYKTTLNLDDKKVRIIIQGSYANSTNVRRESDVDVAVILLSTFRTKYRDGISDENYGFYTATYGLDQFREDIFNILNIQLPKTIDKKCKSIKIEESNNTVPTDVVPAIQKRDYTRDYKSDETNYIGSIVIKDLRNDYEITNYPEQHIIEGVKKNSKTHKRYKKIVRIFKQLKIKAADFGYPLGENTSSFLIESMVFNVPDVNFKNTNSLKSIVENVIKYWNNNITAMEKEFVEANNIKKLFQSDSRINGKNRFISAINSWLEV
ncbi:nucleotidyltransferase domain-containing protein [Mycoplasmatota bacterium]|nr:nucleotidyltransferase domain-containing protein [Mycoplasmatota bacterium]